MGAVIALELLLEQVRTVVSAALWDFRLTPASWQVMVWLRVERNEGATRLGELTCRRRQKVQRILEGLEERGFVERLPDMTRDRTGAWTLTHEGMEIITRVSRRIEVFDTLLEREFRDQLPGVIEAVQRIRTVFVTQSLSSLGEMYEARLRSTGGLAPPRQWRAANWDL